VCTVLVVDLFGLTTFNVMASSQTFVPAYTETGAFIRAPTHKMSLYPASHLRLGCVRTSRVNVLVDIKCANQAIEYLIVQFSLN